MNNMLDYIAVGIALIALIFSMMQYFSEKRRARREATIKAFDELENNVFYQNNYNKCFEYEKYSLEHDALRNKYLSMIEHYSVGVNSGLYDIKTLKRLGGSFVVEQYDKWKPIIEKKNENKEDGKKSYKEFSDLADKLRKM